MHGGVVAIPWSLRALMLQEITEKVKALKKKSKVMMASRGAQLNNTQGSSDAVCSYL